MYSSDRFIEYARQHLNIEVSDEAIEEVREIREADEKEAISPWREMSLLTGLPLGASVSDMRARQQEVEALEERLREVQALYERSPSTWALLAQSALETEARLQNYVYPWGRHFEETTPNTLQQDDQDDNDMEIDANESQQGEE
jgi:hypothetical protein